MLANNKRRLAYFGLILVILLIPILIFISFIEIVQNQFIELHIESPSAYLPRGDWLSTEHTIKVFQDSQNKYYIWHRETSVYDKTYDLGSPYDSWNSVFNYFDHKLSELGWKSSQEQAYNPCELFLAESFFPPDENAYVTFRQNDSKILAEEPIICLAIWSVANNGENIREYKIVLSTINPSFFTRWANNYLD